MQEYQNGIIIFLNKAFILINSQLEVKGYIPSLLYAVSLAGIVFEIKINEFLQKQLLL